MKININNKTFLVLLLFIPFIQPVFFTRIKHINNLYVLAMIFTIVVTGILFFRTLKLKKYTIVFLIYQLFYLITSYLNNMSVYAISKIIIMNIVLCLLIEYLAMNDAKSLLSGLKWLLGGLVTINLCLLILYPEGLISTEWGDAIHFLEANNKLTPILILTMTCWILDSLYRKNSISVTTCIIISMCIMTIVFVWSATGVVAIIVFLINLVFMYNKRLSKKINIWHYIIFFVVAFLIFVIFRLQDYFSTFIVGFLKKDITFSNRTYIWDYAFSIINDASLTQLLVGHGYNVRLIPVNLMGTFYQTHPHNEILRIILESGILGLGMFSALMSMTANKLLRYRKNKMALILMGALLSFFVMGLSETCFYVPFYIIIILSNNIDSIILQNKT